MSATARQMHRNGHEHSVPWFWPFAAAIELGEEGVAQFQENLRFLATAEQLAVPPLPKWATANRVLLDLDTMRLRDFSSSPNSAGARTYRC